LLQENWHAILQIKKSFGVLKRRSPLQRSKNV